jgi:hypothetical protein
MDAQPEAATNHLRATLGDQAVRVLDWLSLLVWGLVAVVGIMQSRHEDGGWLTTYGGDVFGPMAFWWGLRRTVFASLKFGAEIAAFTQWVGCFAWEFCQKLDLSNTVLFFTAGVFDPFDLVAYSVTLLGCYLLDKALQRYHRSRTQSEARPSNVA